MSSTFDFSKTVDCERGRIFREYLQPMERDSAMRKTVKQLTVVMVFGSAALVATGASAFERGGHAGGPGWARGGHGLGPGGHRAFRGGGHGGVAPGFYRGRRHGGAGAFAGRGYYRPQRH